MKRKFSGERVGRSSFFANARARAAEYARSPQKLNRLLDRASQKIYRRQGPLSEILDSLRACIRLLRAWADGSYREIPSASLISILAAVIYLVAPLDMVPDFILALGLLDDAALLGWIISSLKTDIDRFLDWERQQSAGDGKQALTNPQSDKD